MYCVAEVGKQIIKSPRISNPQILGLIPLLQNCKFLRMYQLANRKSANFYKILTQFCLKAVLKVVFLHSCMRKFELEHYMLYFSGKKVCICGSYNSANHKNSGSATRKSAKCHNCERSASITNYFSPSIFGFAICGIYLRMASFAV